jgi:hypothetical protein
MIYQEARASGLAPPGMPYLTMTGTGEIDTFWCNFHMEATGAVPLFFLGNDRLINHESLVVKKSWWLKHCSIKIWTSNGFIALKKDNIKQIKH